MYLNPPRPFLLRPKLKWKLGKTMDTIVVQEQAARLHVQSMGTAMDMITLGDLDFLLTLHDEEAFFRPWIHDWITMAVSEGVEAEEHYKLWCRIAGFDVDVDNETIRFADWLPEDDELRRVLLQGK